MLTLTHRRTHQRGFFPDKNLPENLFMNLLTSTKSFSSKTCWTFSDDYVRSTTKGQFWFPWERCLNSDKRRRNKLQSGTRQRGLLSHGGKPFEAIIPLNRYSYRIFIRAVRQTVVTSATWFWDCVSSWHWNNFQNDGTGGRVVAQKFELWVPHLTLISEGQK